MLRRDVLRLFSRQFISPYEPFLLNHQVDPPAVEAEVVEAEEAAVAGRPLIADLQSSYFIPLPRFMFATHNDSILQ
jgi:hypothetical protein